MCKKKILFVIDTLRCGGAEKSLISLLNAFDYERYDVKLQLHTLDKDFLRFLPHEVQVLSELSFISNCRIGLSRILKISNFKFLIKRIYLAVGIRIEKIIGNIHPSQAYWKYAQSAFKIFNETFDVAIAWGQGFPTHYVASKIIANKKFAVINADYSSLKLNRDFDLNYYKKFQKIMTVSDKLKELTIDVFPEFKDKFYTLYDFNNAALIQKLAKNNRDPFNNDDCIKIVTVGRLVKAKGYDILLDAAVKLKKQNLNYKWFVIGEGVERDFIERQIEQLNLIDRVFLLGEMENPYPYMKNADVYVQTSKNEGFCLTLAEARILNTPVVSTNFDAVHNHIHHKHNGLITEKNGQSVAEAVVEMLNNNKLREEIINNLSIEKKGNIEEIYKLYSYIEE